MARAFSDGTVFPVPENRSAVTSEPDLDGTHEPELGSDIDWVGFRNQGGGHVPDDFEWRSCPKEVQEKLSHG